MAQVKFVQCTSTEYEGATKDAATLYFLTDTQQIFKGTVQYSLTNAREEVDDVADGDQILISDSSESNKIKRCINFNTTDPKKFLREDGTWQTASVGINVDSGTSLPSTGNVGDIFVLYTEV